MGAGERVYLDYNATAPVRPAVAEAVARALLQPGNASSVHAEGRAARGAVEAAREQVAALAGVRSRQVVFTGGGTEGAATVLSPGFRRAGKAGSTLLLVGAAEHPCVLDGHRFPPEAVERIPVSGEGVVDLGWLEGRLARAPGPVLVSIQAANNETGVIQPVPEAARLVGRAGGLLHVDAVQAAGRIDLGSLDADALTLSAHKIGGPQGVGAIVMGSESLEFADRLLRGGGQERGHRAGTENVAGIVGFGVAAEIAARELATEPARLAGLRDAFEAGLREAVPGAVVFGAGAARLPNTSAFAIPGVRAETALIRLDLAGIAVSSGAACSSGKVRRSHVLAAMGVDPRLAEGAVRASFGWGSTSADVARLLGACETLGASLYKRKADAA